MPLTDPSANVGPGTVLGDRFIVVEAVAAGAQGEVFRAEDREIRGLVVAVKVMRYAAHSEVAREVALRELELLAAVRHPSVLQFLDYGWFEGRLWYAMPWLVGETLEGKRLPRAAAQRIFERLAAGLHALHSAGIRHQDIKPENVFLARIDGYDEPMPILLDLGVAVRAGETLAAGSLGYFAPEVAAAWPMPNPSLDARADVFALALTLREVLEPETLPALPTSEAEVPAYLRARATVPLPPPSRFDLRHLRRPFARWLSLDPEARPTADAFRRQLAILTEPERRRRRLLRRGLVALVVGLLVAFGVHQTRRAEALRHRSRAEAENAEARTAEADAAKIRAAKALEEAQRAEARANEALAHASESEEEAARASQLKLEAEAAADLAREAQKESIARTRAAREATEAAELARRAAEQQAATADLERRALQSQLEAATTARDRAAADLEAERARSRALTEAKAAAEAALADERARSEQARAAAARELSAAVAARDAAAAARDAAAATIAELEQRVAALERRIAELSAAGGAPPSGPPASP
jgi:hypothetical protein